MESVEPTVQLEPTKTAFSDASHSAEAALLSDAVRALRRLRDPRLALARLDEHAARFTTTGRFAREALLARIEAHLALAQRNEALAILEPLAINTIPRPRPLYLLRGDLRAADGRCQAALPDFDAAMSAASDDTAERALRGKAICRSRLGDKLGAKSEVRRHLLLFPQHPQGSWLVEKLGPL